MAVMAETNEDDMVTEEERGNQLESEGVSEPESGASVNTPSEERTSTQIDLNSASREDLQQLPGVGPRLASEIIAYREANGPFLETEEITNVPGIGSIRYDEWSGRLTATLPESELGEDVTPPPIPEVEPVKADEEEKTESIKPELTTEETVTSQVEAPPETVSPEDTISVSETEQPEEAQEAPPTTDEEMREKKRQRPSLTWLWTALLGGVLGLIFSLIVLAGINQTLDYASSRDMRASRQNLVILSNELEGLGSDLQDVQAQVNELADLTTRMEQAETDVDTLKITSETLTEKTETLSDDLASVQTTVAELTSDMDEVQAQTETTMNFFEELGRLLQEIFGSTEPEAGILIPSAPTFQKPQGRL
jgi:competence ComEA-like helix-hairpin-helix protein